MLCFNFNLFLALAATADGQRTECQKNFNATELINSAPNVLNGENAQKWVQKHAFGVLCCKKFEPKFEWADSVEQKNIFKILQKLKSEFCRQLDEGNGMEMAAQKVQNLTQLAQILEETPKIRENIQKAQENAKNGAKLDKFEIFRWKDLLSKNNLTTKVQIDQLMQNVYLAFNAFANALKGRPNKQKCHHRRQTGTPAATGGRRRRRRMVPSLVPIHIELQRQAARANANNNNANNNNANNNNANNNNANDLHALEHPPFDCRCAVLLMLGTASFVSIFVAVNSVTRQLTAENLMFLIAMVCLFLNSAIWFFFHCTKLCVWCD
uniref:Uncharacterized protein n=1 Tax=Globodera rostochiensis TaxID=31243 RepID=A0A914GTW4_GLORO